MKRKVTFRQRLRYAFDNTMAKGTPALVAWLGFATAGLVFAFSLLIVAARLAPVNNAGVRPGFGRQLFDTLVHAFDSGAFAGDWGNVAFFLAMMGVTIGGIFIVSALIGVISAAFDARLDELRKGRSLVLEEGHTLILGWSEAVFTILSELAIAKESESHPVVVVMADRDKVEMEDAIRSKVGHMGKTRVVCRSGVRVDLADLEIVSPHQARAIIVLAEDEDEPDADVIKTVLALTQGPDRQAEPYHIVAEIQDTANLEAARIVGGSETVLLDKSRTIARLLVQASRQSGISVVYTDLFDFGGDEIYFRADPALVGKTFHDARQVYEECTVIGVRTPAGSRLNPPGDTVLDDDDEVIALAGDDSTLAVARASGATVDPAAIDVSGTLPQQAQRVLILGWNGRSASVVHELDQYLQPGSAVTVVADHSGARAEIADRCGGLRNLTLDFREGNTTARPMLDALDVGGYDSVIVMCYSDTLTPQRADARTLVTLLHLREIASRSGRVFSIVSEMLDDRNRRLAQVTKVDDVIVSEKMISLIAAQISESPHLADVLADILDAEGSEVYLRPAAHYLRLGTPVNFATVVEAAGRRGETAIGFRDGSEMHDPARNYGVSLNPPKTRLFTPGKSCRVIVLAEN
jgi:voltage-gated potassium channel Kch